MRTPYLFARVPGVETSLPWRALATLPTPLAAVPISLDGRTIPLLVKRDDLTGAEYGGNKVRKLEFLLADAQRQGAERLITAGAFGSHHALATAVYGRRLGLATSCVLFPQHVTPHVRTVLRGIAAQGAELRFTRRLEGVPIATVRARFAHRAERCCVIPPGGSNALGTLGYVEAALELDAQLRAAGETPSAVYVAAGTLGTAAGMAVGFALAGRELPVFATRITSALVTNERVLEKLVRGALAVLGRAGAPLPAPEAALRLVRLRHDQIGAGYGRATEAADVASQIFAEAGLTLDATYTAKAAAALLADLAQEARPLFWHTLSAAEPEATSVEPGSLPAPFARALTE